MSDPILDLAQQFSLDPPPPDYSGRLDFLTFYYGQAKQVVDLLPEPAAYDASSVLSDMGDVRKIIKRVAETWVPGMAVINRIDMAGDVLRNFVLGAFITASYGAQIHSPYMREAVLNGGLMTPEQLNHDYFQRLGLLQGIVHLGKSGVLDPLFEQGAGAPPKSMNGAMGALPLWAVAVIVIVAFAVIAAMAYIVVQIASIAATNKIIDSHIERLCYDAQGRPIPAVQGKCLQLLSDLDKNKRIAVGGADDLIAQVVKYAAIGVGAYALIVLLPQVVRSVRKARAEAR